VTECDVTSVLTSADCDPYAVVVPYETCELEGWSVVHVIVAVVEVIPVAVTPLITGGGPPARVAKVEFADAAAFPEGSIDSAAKLYVVPGFRPVSVIECDVLNVLTRGDCSP
jgi:hypothetical protein